MTKKPLEPCWASKHNVELTPESLLRHADSYSRLPVLFTLRPFCDVEEWYRLLGREWSGCDNIATYSRKLMSAFQSDKWVYIEQMMSNEERAARDALRPIFTAYRGCYEHNQDGFSYSLDRDIAAGFPFKTHYTAPGQPLLVQANVRRSRAILKLDRDEGEVITINPRIIAVEELPKQR